MPRLKLQEQPEYEFRYHVTLQVRDLNYGAHLSNDAVVGLLHEARLNLLRGLGLSEMDLGDGQTGLIMGDLAVNFKAEGFLFDSVRIDSHIDEISRNSFRIFHRMVRGEAVLVLAETGFVAFNYAQRRVAAVPEAFGQKVSQLKTDFGQKE
jgi:acyl-CoA thioester hydrolase